MYFPVFPMLVAMVLSAASLAMAQVVPPEIKTIFIKVDPRGTYLFVDTSPPPIYPTDAANGPTRFSLLPLYQDPEIQLKAGDLIGFELVGAFQFTYPYYGGYDGAQSLLGLFNSPVGYLYPGPMGSVSGVVSLPSYYRGISTDIPEDFNIPPGANVYAQVPEGATEVLFSPNDAYFVDNSDPNNDYGVYLKISVLKKPKYVIQKALYENGQAVGASFHQMPPSRLPCGRAPAFYSLRTMRFKCLKEVTNENGPTELVPVGGCTMQIHFEDGLYDGGHNRNTHPDVAFRWGKFLEYTEGETIVIPAEGIELTYEAPEVSGEVKAVFTAKDPVGGAIASLPGTLFQVRHQENFVELNIPGLLVDIESHPGDGFFVTQKTQDALSAAVVKFRGKVAEIYGESFTPTLETEGASLAWGGLFDYKKNWSTPHCGHRRGVEVDLSMSVFGQFDAETKQSMKKILDRYIRKQGFSFPIHHESIGNVVADHWHVRGN